MKIIEGSKVPIYCWAENLEGSAVEQARDVANHPQIFHHVAIMPDGHAGYGMPIGGVAALRNAVSPYMVGNDIACSMMAARLDGFRKSDFEEMALRKTIHDAIKREVPVGVKHNSDWHLDPETVRAEELLSEFGEEDEIINLDSVADQLGTLGGGNHFLEIQYDENKAAWVMVHCGSRNIGAKVCQTYYKKAVDYCDYKGIVVPNKHLSFFHLDSAEGQDYWRKMMFCMKFSHMNKIVILDRVRLALTKIMKKACPCTEFHLVHHNFAAIETHFGEEVVVHRKGATPASVGTVGIIPGNMSSASFVVEGMGNLDSFRSCSHGAGRAMSRTQAKDTISLSAIKRQMEGIYFDACKGIIEEAPDAYKNIDVVMQVQTEGDSPLVEIVHSMRPMINIKDTSDENPKNRMKNKDRTCPNGHVFGLDFDKFKQCKLQFCDEKDRNACRHRMTVLKIQPECN